MGAHQLSAFGGSVAGRRPPAGEDRRRIERALVQDDRILDALNAPA